MSQTLLRCASALLCVVAAGSTTIRTSDVAVQRSLPRNTYLGRFALAYYPGRSGQLFLVAKEGHIITRRDPTVKYMHGSPWPYDTRIPFLLYGPAFIRPGTFLQPVTQREMAPTLASLLGVPMPGTAVGQPQRHILKPAAPRPRAVVLAVLDGMRADYFDRHRTAMPTFDRLRRQGAWFGNARIDYLPSITGVAHATIATGAHPRVHGIVGNAFFDGVAGRATDSYPALSPRYLMAPTLSDVWNVHTSGRAVIIGQGSVGRAALPLAGHGACQLNGYPVIAVSYSSQTGRWETNPDCYRMPDYLKDADARELWEGREGVWMGHPIASAADIRGSALFSTFEARALMSMIDREPLGADDVTDLVLVNLKTPDFVGHRYGPESPELREALASLDHDFARVIDALDAKLGRDRYAVAITADHGMPPEPDAKQGRERHFTDDLVKAIHARFDPERSALVKHFEPENCQIAIDRGRLRELGIDLTALARFLEEQPFIFAAYTDEEVSRAVTSER